MLNETRVEGLALTAGANAVNALIDTQVILQLLVKKGIVTPEEVVITRGIVNSQPKYKRLLESIDSAMNKVDEAAKFEELFTKSLQPNGREQLTEEEKDYLLKKLDEMSIEVD